MTRSKLNFDKVKHICLGRQNIYVLQQEINRLTINTLKARIANNKGTGAVVLFVGSKKATTTAYKKRDEQKNMLVSSEKVLFFISTP